MLAASAPADLDLLQRVGAQDLDAFTMLIDRYQPIALGVAAEDAVWAAFLTLWRGAARHDPADLTPPHDWLVLLTRYFALDASRQPPPAR